MHMSETGNETVQLTDDQKRYFQTIFDYLEEYGTWPTFTLIDRVLYRNAGLDAEEIAMSIGKSIFGTGYMPWAPPDTPVTLPLRIVALCDGSKHLMELVVATVDLAVKTERQSDSPRITSKQLQDGWQVSERDLRRLGAVLLAGLSFWISFGGPDESGAWSMDIGRGVRKFQDAKTIDQLLALLPPLPPKPASSPASLFEALDQKQAPSVVGHVLVEISVSLGKFRRDHPEANKTAFIMMPFAKTPALIQIAAVIKETLGAHDLEGLRADDKAYHPDLYWNVITYMHGCRLGVAVFERIKNDYFNPNVSLEVGYMLALGKSVCLLKDESLTTLNADLAGKLYQDFDTRGVEESIPQELTKWLSDNDFL
jgi:hypothetical protein